MKIEEIAHHLLIYGPLGIGWIGLGWAYWQERKARDQMGRDHLATVTALQREFLSKQEELMQAHAVQVQTLQERLASRSETYASKVSEFAAAQQNLLEAVTRR